MFKEREKQEVSICAQQMRGALALFLDRLALATPPPLVLDSVAGPQSFPGKKKKIIEVGTKKEKKKEKEVSCCFLQPPSSSSSFGSRAVNIPWKRRRLLLLLLRALPASPSPSSSGVHGASGSCCCADMMALAIVSKMRRFHGARARARSVTEGRVGGTRMIPVQNVPFHVRS